MTNYRSHDFNQISNTNEWDADIKTYKVSNTIYKLPTLF